MTKEKIDRKIIEKLIEIGNSPYPDQPEKIPGLIDIKDSDYINRLHWNDWDVVTIKMPLDDLVALVKGLALSERYHGWMEGSVSSVIWTFREVERRDIERSNRLADWILPRTRNPYVPFGSTNYGASSLSSYLIADDLDRQRRINSLEAQRLDKERADAEKEVRKRQRSNSFQDRDNEAREIFLEELSRLPIREQLIRLAFDEKYSVEFYPTKLADSANSSIISSLDDNVSKALHIKLRGKHKGPWKNFKEHLPK